MALVQKSDRLLQDTLDMREDAVSAIMEYIITIICAAIFILVPLYMKSGQILR